jgi:hypothetical protein
MSIEKTGVGRDYLYVDTAPHDLVDQQTRIKSNLLGDFRDDVDHRTAVERPNAASYFFLATRKTAL